MCHHGTAQFLTEIFIGVHTIEMPNTENNAPFLRDNNGVLDRLFCNLRLEILYRGLYHVLILEINPAEFLRHRMVGGFPLSFSRSQASCWCCNLFILMSCA